MKSIIETERADRRAKEKEARLANRRARLAEEGINNIEIETKMRETNPTGFSNGPSR